MSTAFQNWFGPWILRRDVEGGFSNHRNDRGGATNFGITIHLAQLLPDGDEDGFLDGDINRDGTVDIDDIHAMDDQDALDIYYRYFWRPNKCDDMNPQMAVCLCDGLVNHQPKPARRLFQMGLGLKGKHVDGIIGPNTLHAAEMADIDQFLVEYLSHRAEFYKSIVTADSSQASFLRGWFARLFRLQHYILERMS